MYRYGISENVPKYVKGSLSFCPSPPSAHALDGQKSQSPVKVPTREKFEAKHEHLATVVQTLIKLPVARARELRAQSSDVTELMIHRRIPSCSLFTVETWLTGVIRLLDLVGLDQHRPSNLQVGQSARTCPILRKL